MFEGLFRNEFRGFLCICFQFVLLIKRFFILLFGHLADEQQANSGINLGKTGDYRRPEFSLGFFIRIQPRHQPGDEIEVCFSQPVNVPDDIE